jgi:hypothetical protein
MAAAGPPEAYNRMQLAVCCGVVLYLTYLCSVIDAVERKLRVRHR